MGAVAEGSSVASEVKYFTSRGRNSGKGEIQMCASSKKKEKFRPNLFEIYRMTNCDEVLLGLAAGAEIHRSILANNRRFWFNVMPSAGADESAHLIASRIRIVSVTNDEIVAIVLVEKGLADDLVLQAEIKFERYQDGKIQGDVWFMPRVINFDVRMTMKPSIDMYAMREILSLLFYHSPEVCAIGRIFSLSMFDEAMRTAARISLPGKGNTQLEALASIGVLKVIDREMEKEPHYRSALTRHQVEQIFGMQLSPLPPLVFTISDEEPPTPIGHANLLWDVHYGNSDLVDCYGWQTVIDLDGQRADSLLGKQGKDVGSLRENCVKLIRIDWNEDNGKKEQILTGIHARTSQQVAAISGGPYALVTRTIDHNRWIKR
jgi:hypothetical protein